ncbi:hypothetical protein NLI96_g12307 [Meripilus lineatus]|uniref:Uncharacterized protein n=1 Tax=Meripilus lineatus TaxID=2056292 RepID=A0AAD5URI8_9APHY|nr:hypothetical protein NLI96_g12307 [Physisporinus lineatus]
MSFSHRPYIALLHLIFVPMDTCDDIDTNSHRTRINIAISCISTIFLCTWVAFHPNIPGPDEPKWKVIRRKISCMIGGILAPEIYVLLAARQFIAARYLTNKYRGQGWTLTHGFFALMGGLVLYHGEEAARIIFYDPGIHTDPFVDDFLHEVGRLEAFERRLATPRLKPPLSRSTDRFGHILAALEYIRLNNVIFKHVSKRARTNLRASPIHECIGLIREWNVIENNKVDKLRSDYSNKFFLRDRLEDVLLFLSAYEHYITVRVIDRSKDTDCPAMVESADGTKGSISSHISNSIVDDLRLRNHAPRINEQDIQDKSKSDMLTKTIALFQVAWFILQLCARYHENLAITELEIFTLAFCILNFATYALWWKKPFAVDRGYAIRWRDDDWEVIAPPFVETEEVPWYRWCLNWIKRIMQALALCLSYRTVPSGCHEIQGKVFPFYSFHRDRCFIILPIPVLVVSLEENQAFSSHAVVRDRGCGGSSVPPIDQRGDGAP